MFEWACAVYYAAILSNGGEYWRARSSGQIWSNQIPRLVANPTALREDICEEGYDTKLEVALSGLLDTQSGFDGGYEAEEFVEEPMYDEALEATEEEAVVPDEVVFVPANDVIVEPILEEDIVYPSNADDTPIPEPVVDASLEEAEEEEPSDDREIEEDPDLPFDEEEPELRPSANLLSDEAIADTAVDADLGIDGAEDEVLGDFADTEIGIFGAVQDEGEEVDLLCIYDGDVGGANNCVVV
jgi:hypothetical protein